MESTNLPAASATEIKPIPVIRDTRFDISQTVFSLSYMSDLIETAYAIAYQAHDGVFRKNKYHEPYFTHPRNAQCDICKVLSGHAKTRGR